MLNDANYQDKVKGAYGAFDLIKVIVVEELDSALQPVFSRPPLAYLQTLVVEVRGSYFVAVLCKYRSCRPGSATKI